ncbi:hypothetical protein Syun_014210 [Stephania yunnanensis]|uniref:Retroviral polymerase SH3-like domain-containing protein n=1 Tax=Stephania yunnanensis TaxID=152371 RepID=A0AAP0JL11_9MAGN
MLKMAKLPKSFWGEALDLACYLMNRSPSAPLEFDVPERVWSGKDVTYSHLKVFGCKTFMYVPKEQRRNLMIEAVPCILLGFGDAEFGYRLWDQEKKKIVRSRDVAFHEYETITDLKTSKKIIVDDDDVSGLESSSITDATHEGDSFEEHGVDVRNRLMIFEREGEQTPPPTALVEPSLRRSERGLLPSTRYPSSNYVTITEEGEPESFQKV